MGQRASNTSGVTFEDVVIPQEVLTCCTCTLYVWFFLAISSTVGSCV